MNDETNPTIASRVEQLDSPIEGKFSQTPEASNETTAVETKVYSDGTTVTGVPPLPDLSPAEIDAYKAEAIAQSPGTIMSLRGVPMMAGGVPISFSDAPTIPFSGTVMAGGVQPFGTGLGALVLPELTPQTLAFFTTAALGAITTPKALEAITEPNDQAAVDAIEHLPGIHVNVIEVEHARALPEATSGALYAAVFAPGSIEHFMDDDGAGNRRPMAIAVDAAGDLRKVWLGD